MTKAHRRTSSELDIRTYVLYDETMRSGPATSTTARSLKVLRSVQRSLFYFLIPSAFVPFCSAEQRAHACISHRQGMAFEPYSNPARRGAMRPLDDPTMRRFRCRAALRQILGSWPPRSDFPAPDARFLTSEERSHISGERSIFSRRLTHPLNLV